MPPRHISDALDTQLMVATDGVMALWTTKSTVSFIALALRFSNSNFAQKLRWTRGTQTWEWDFLTGLGRRYLSRFLGVVHSVVVPHAEDEGE